MYKIYLLETIFIEIYVFNQKIEESTEFICI